MTGAPLKELVGTGAPLEELVEVGGSLGDPVGVMASLEGPLGAFLDELVEAPLEELLEAQMREILGLKCLEAGASFGKLVGAPSEELETGVEASLGMKLVGTGPPLEETLDCQ